MTKLRIVTADSIKLPIQPSPGFVKKQLADHKCDLCAVCNYGCSYCSSNSGWALRTKRQHLADLAEEQLGERLYPSTDPKLTILWPEVIERLRHQLERKRPGFGRGKTLVFSMLTDGFGPLLIGNGTTKAALELILELTEFRIRVLTKNAAVGSSRWIDFFAKYPDRFVVGLSIGTLEDEWARRVEKGTSSPSARIRALHNLQSAGVPTFGMLCPIFPDLLENDALERLVDLTRPELVEHLWAEPYNDRDNWQAVRTGYKPNTSGFHWLTQVYEESQKDLWSGYAAELYTRLRSKADADGWLHKLNYLLYEKGVLEADAPQFGDLEGVLLQSTPGADGKSPNQHVAKLQRLNA